MIALSLVFGVWPNQIVQQAVVVGGRGVAGSGLAQIGDAGSATEVVGVVGPVLGAERKLGPTGQAVESVGVAGEEQLKQLAELKAQGVLTEAEFKDQKRKLLVS
ncbi:SHOCT domain-containing protein [Streptomyces sp. MN13]